MHQAPNKAPAPSGRPRFPLAALLSFDYYFCARPASPAAVGEAHRWPLRPAPRRAACRVLMPFILCLSQYGSCAIAAAPPALPLEQMIGETVGRGDPLVLELRVAGRQEETAARFLVDTGSA